MRFIFKQTNKKEEEGVYFLEEILSLTTTTTHTKTRTKFQLNRLNTGETEKNLAHVSILYRFVKN